MNKEFENRLFNEVYSMFQIVSPSSLNIKQIEQLRVHAGKMANILSKQAKLDAIEMFEKLQKSILEAFKEADGRLNILQEQHVHFQKDVDKLITAINQRLDKPLNKADN